jgi:hypothetical protein
MPSIIAERIARYKADNQKRKKMSEGDLDE